MTSNGHMVYVVDRCNTRFAPVSPDPLPETEACELAAALLTDRRHPARINNPDAKRVEVWEGGFSGGRLHSAASLEVDTHLVPAEARV